MPSSLKLLQKFVRLQFYIRHHQFIKSQQAHIVCVCALLIWCQCCHVVVLLLEFYSEFLSHMLPKVNSVLLCIDFNFARLSEITWSHCEIWYHWGGSKLWMWNAHRAVVLDKTQLEVNFFTLKIWQLVSVLSSILVIERLTQWSTLSFCNVF